MIFIKCDDTKRYTYQDVLHLSTQAYTDETSWSSTKSRKIELQSYLMYIKDYVKKTQILCTNTKPSTDTDGA